MTDFIPYGRQTLDEQDVARVTEALRARLITQGPRVEEFERAFAQKVRARHAVAFSSGTAALHGAMAACEGIEGGKVLTTPISFVASSNCALYVGGRPSFVDIDPDTFNLDTASAAVVSEEEDVRAVVAVSLAGLPADLAPLQPLRDRGVRVVEDACHALGARRGDSPVGGDGLADMSVFSLHPVKAITTGEGGMVTTADDTLADRLRAFRNHGISRSTEAEPERAGKPASSSGAPGESRDSDMPQPLPGPWHYDVLSLGFNYRITDFQCALGHSQLDKLDRFIHARNRIALRYRELLENIEGLALPPQAPEHSLHAYHLFIVRFTEGAQRRRLACERLREVGIGTQLHYIPIYRHSLYRTLGYGQNVEEYPHAERYYREALSLPIAPSMTDGEVTKVASALRGIMQEPLESEPRE